VQPQGPIAQGFLTLAAGLVGKGVVCKQKRSLFEPLLSRLQRKKAS
jgi:hypothetical protein